jgi:hypothetical protein
MTEEASFEHSLISRIRQYQTLEHQLRQVNAELLEALTAHERCRHDSWRGLTDVVLQAQEAIAKATHT